MYRSDQEALLQRAEATSREAEELRRENQAMRQAIGTAVTTSPFAHLAVPPPHVFYRGGVDLRTLDMGDRARLANHAVERFPVWATAALNVVTLGLFSFIHFSLMHDKLPRAAHNDPSSGKAIGFQFIPYFNLYWVFFNSLRLCDRLDLQLRLRGLEPHAPRGLTLAACICSVIPYVNLISLPIIWTIAAARLQSTVNRVAELPPTEWDASTP
jgi:hypothetical protein